MHCEFDIFTELMIQLEWTLGQIEIGPRKMRKESYRKGMEMNEILNSHRSIHIVIWSGNEMAT